MSKPAQSEARKLPSAEQSVAIARQSLIAKDKARQLMQPVKDRKKAFYENGGGNAMALSLLEKLLHIAGDNELRADDAAAYCEQAIEIYRSQKLEGRHYGNLVDQAKAGAASDAKAEPAPEPVDPNTVTAPGGLPHDESLARFEANLTKAANQKKASKVLDIPALDPDAPPAPPPAATEAAPAEKPKRGRPPKAAAKTDAAPPPPPAAVGGLPDDDEEDIRPAFLRQREEERKAAEPVH